MTAGSVFYAKQDMTYVLKFVGDVRYTVGVSLDAFLDSLFQRLDFNDILIDLTETRSIDSTNLGLLARVANFLRQRFDRRTTIISPDEDVNRTLESVGFDSVFTICRECEPPEGVEWSIPVKAPSQDALRETVYEAHRILCELNEGNREAFKDVVDALEGPAGTGGTAPRRR